ncbi:MAG: class I SAM-dependent methyltransferase [Paracoccaceae bacterium]
MTPLAQALVRRISATGPISVAAFMNECLLHPEHGYYNTAQVFGHTGDFVTAPEVNQMFGELIGLCLAQSWIDQGSPAEFVLAELGPGRGTLMADVLRATKRIAGLRQAARIELVEASPKLRAVQRKTLQDHRIGWRDSVHDLPDAPLFLIANEFFDALPIRQYRRDENGWCERRVGVRDDTLVFGLSAPVSIGELDHRHADTKPGDWVETCATATSVMHEISRRIQARGGAAIIVDYGDWRSLGDTLQAVRNHAFDDVLAHPGHADLSAHVDFEALARAARPARVTPIITQSRLLENLGINIRAQILADILKGDDRASHLAALRRLTHKDEMGTLFKTIAVHATDSPPPPGFAP